MAEKRVLCSSCDIYCQVLVETNGAEILRVKALDTRPGYANICMKGVHAPAGFNHKDRVLYPLRRKGDRGSGEWEQVSWAAAMDDIAERLRRTVDAFGPEALAVATSSWNTQTDNGMGRRFMNLLGSPNWISGVALCAGNTAAINRMVYGWFPYPDFTKTNCVVLFGHNPKPHSWTPVYNSIVRAQERGAKLIVLDPRRSESAERADIWLPLKVGTDAAMAFGWLKVIVDNGLYDKSFVDKWTIGFDRLCERVDEFSLDRVAKITGVAPDKIEEAARLYAASGPAVIPWTPITDQQRNSTSAIRLQCTLRAICGYIDVPGGEVLHGFHPKIVSESELELHDALPDTQKAKQLGAGKHPAFTYRGIAALKQPTKEVWGHDYANLVSGSYMANPSAVFRAMADGDPYPVKALITLGNNTLLGFANMQLIHRAFMNQDLIVAHEHIKTPTAQLADYILPGDAWTERPAIADGFGWTSIYRSSQQAVLPPGEARGVYDFWRELAMRFGFEEHFPWHDVNELLDYRLAGLGMSFDTFADEHAYHVDSFKFRKYETTGFATPSGKVELASSILGELGFDELPYWREEPEMFREEPLRLFTGVREDPFFQTGHRHIAPLRERAPEPLMYLNPITAEQYGLAGGDMAIATTAQGRVTMKVAVRDDMPERLVRIPHGWWLPEEPGTIDGLSGAWEMADAQLCRDDDDFLDAEQGIPHLKGIPCQLFTA
ncbi:MAG: molybdopterin-containing oxidoreductase family protein [Hyphomicrobiaceae bacterium]